MLKKPLDESIQAIRARRPKRLPTVLTREEARQVIDAMTGAPQLVIKILYGSGLRLMECLRLRVKDIDFSTHQIVVRDAKGNKDRLTMLPASMEEPLQHHPRLGQMIHEADLENGLARTLLPFPLEGGIQKRQKNKGCGISSHRPLRLLHSVGGLPFVWPASGS